MKGENIMTSKKIIAVDFDGTLVFNQYPDISGPNIELINFIKENQDKYIFILNTLRHDKELDDALEYLEKFDLHFEYVNENVRHLVDTYGDTRKIAADYYIDDRNLTLQNWKEILNN